MVTQEEVIAAFVPTLPIHLEIWEYMIENAIGPSNMVKAREIAEALEIRDNAEHTLTRGIIREMVMRDRLPIVASSRGYYVAIDPHQVRACADSLRKRGWRIVYRADTLDDTAERLEEALKN